MSPCVAHAVTLRSTASRAGALRSTTTQTKGRDACIHAEVKEVVDERSEEHRLRDSQGPDYLVGRLRFLDSASRYAPQNDWIGVALLASVLV